MMKTIRATLVRKDKTEKQTTGDFKLFNNGLLIFECKSLELPSKENKRRISCINTGDYVCILRYSEKYKWHFHVTDVEGRTWILIHFGNYYTDTLGCILLGNKLIDINGDGQPDVTSSKKTLKRLVKLAGGQFNLTIS